MFMIATVPMPSFLSDGLLTDLFGSESGIDHSPRMEIY
jgi:hypothetical protein